MTAGDLEISTLSVVINRRYSEIQHAMNVSVALSTLGNLGCVIGVIVDRVLVRRVN